MQSAILSEKTLNKKLLRFGLLFYLLVFMIWVGTFIATHFKFYQIDWTQYYNDSNYAVWVDTRVKPHGVMQITGNQTGFHDFLLITPFLLGVLLSAVIFVLLWRTYRGRSFMPLIALVGYLFPFFPMPGVNLLSRIGIGLFFILFGSIATILTTKVWARLD